MIDMNQRLADEARAAGFDAIGIVQPDAIGQAGKRLAEFIELGRHGTMTWMEQRLNWRQDPRVLWPDARSLVVLVMNYGPPDNELATSVASDCGNISVYARHRDYHDLIKKRLKRVARWLVSETGEQVKVFVDTAPVMEKPLAQEAGLGWQGKHTNLVSRQYGSWLFIGSIFTTAELKADDREVDHCGTCRNCLDVCPTDAFPAPYQLDARRCISYLTIESKDVVPEEFRAAIGNRIYGCDDCLAVCPWNKFAQKAQQSALLPREDLRSPKLDELIQLDEADFRSFFSKNPIKRIGRNKFISNVLIAMGNSGDASLLGKVQKHINHEDARVSEAAAWARKQLRPQ